MHRLAVSNIDGAENLSVFNLSAITEMIAVVQCPYKIHDILESLVLHLAPGLETVNFCQQVFTFTIQNLTSVLFVFNGSLRGLEKINRFANIVEKRGVVIEVCAYTM